MADSVHQGLKSRVDRIQKGDTEESVIKLLGSSPTKRESQGSSTKLIWACPGHASSYIYAVIEDGKVVESGWHQ